MKYAVLVGDGMADYPIKELDGLTPLEKSRTPNMDWIAKNGSGGKAVTVPRRMKPGSDIANLSILGVDPKEYYSGRGPLEAASMGIDLSPDEVAFRCNLVTVNGGVMDDYSAGHVPNNESEVLMDILNKELGREYIKFYHGVSYRNLMVIKDSLLEDGRSALRCVPPHDISGKKIKGYLPKGKGSSKLRELMEKSVSILKKHEINQVKLDLKENPANMIWLWGQGKKPSFPSFKEKFGVTSGIISAVGLLKGIGKCLGMEVIDVPGATGYYDTDYNAKAQYAIGALARLDLIFVHVEAPDEAGHNGDLRNKIIAIENFDEKVVGPILEWLKGQGEYKILILPDHPTPLRLRTHVSDPVPFAICGKDTAQDKMEMFTEKQSKKGSFGSVLGSKLMELVTA